MNNDFRKFATRHLGVNGMMLDDVAKVQQQYLNPYILEERQLNVTQFDVFSRLMMDRILWIIRWIFQSISIPQAEALLQVLAFMTPCSLSAAR